MVEISSKILASEEKATTTTTTLCLDSSIVSLLQLHWVKAVCVFRCNLPPAPLPEWPRSFTCHCGNMGVEWTLNNSQHTQSTLEKKILPPLLPRFKLATFRSLVWHSNQQAIPAPDNGMYRCMYRCINACDAVTSPLYYYFYWVLILPL